MFQRAGLAKSHREVEIKGVGSRHPAVLHHQGKKREKIHLIKSTNDFSIRKKFLTTKLTPTNFIKI